MKKIFNNLGKYFKIKLNAKTCNLFKSLDFSPEVLEEYFEDIETIKKIFEIDPCVENYSKILASLLNKDSPFIELNPFIVKEQQTNFDTCLMISDIIDEAEKILKEENNIIGIDLDEEDTLTIVGDTHGQFCDVVEVFKKLGAPGTKTGNGDHKYLFLGDYIDRGPQSLCNLVTLLLLKCEFPNEVYLLRGNHEAPSLNYRYGFVLEIVETFGEELGSFLFFNSIHSFFESLPVASIVNQKIFACHGGIGFRQKNMTIKKIQSVKRHKYNEFHNNEILTSLLWSDPVDYVERIDRSPRGAGYVFGVGQTENFFKVNNLNNLVRSHESSCGSHKFNHDEKVLTIFSCPNYGNSKNKGTVLQIYGSTDKLDFENSCELIFLEDSVVYG